MKTAFGGRTQSFVSFRVIIIYTYSFVFLVKNLSAFVVKKYSNYSNRSKISIIENFAPHTNSSAAP
jgi:hypothetical protein